MKSIIKKISKYNYSLNNNIKYIVIHDTGNFKDTAKGNANYFNGGNRRSSAHYFVDNNSIYQIVENYNAAWHVGDGHSRYGIGNHNSIGVEMCNSGGYISKDTIKNTLELVKYLMDKYNVSIDRVVRHYDASKKNCPANLNKDRKWSGWIEFKRKLNNTPAASSKHKRTYSINYCKKWQEWYNKITQTAAPLLADGIYGPKTEKTFASLLSYIEKSRQYKYCLEFQCFYNNITQTSSPLKLDGYWGTNTKAATIIMHKLIKREY